MLSVSDEMDICTSWMSMDMYVVHTHVYAYIHIFLLGFKNNPELFQKKK